MTKPLKPLGPGVCKICNGPHNRPFLWPPGWCRACAHGETREARAAGRTLARQVETTPEAMQRLTERADPEPVLRTAHDYHADADAVARALWYLTMAVVA